MKNVWREEKTTVAIYFAIAFLVCLIFASMTGPALAAGQLIDSSNEVLINQNQNASQDHATVAVDSAGIFVAYTSSDIGADTSGKAATLRAFEDDFNPTTDEFAINETVTLGDQRVPDVITNDQYVVVVWSSQSATGYDVYAKVYNTALEVVTNDFQVNTTSSSIETYPAVGLWDNGDFIVMWDEVNSNGGLNYYIRAYHPTGEEITAGPIQINSVESSPPLDDQYIGLAFPPDIDAWGSAGDAVAAWEQFVDQGENKVAIIRSLKFNIYEQPFTGEEDVRTPGPGVSQKRPSVDVNGRGDILITWTEGATANTDIYVKKEDGVTGVSGVGCPHLNSPFLSLSQHRSVGKLLEEGQFIVAWTSDTYGYSDDVFFRFFSAQGTALCNETRVNQTRQNIQRRPAVDWKIINNNQLYMIITWESGLGSTFDIYARSYTIQL